MTLRLHLHAHDAGGYAHAVCGWQAVACTTEIESVTCRKCLGVLREAAEKKEAAERRPDGAFYYTGRRLVDVRHAVETLVDVVAGDYAGKRAVRRLETRYASVSHALAEMAVLNLDGIDTTSVHNPTRLERLAGRLGGTGDSGGRAPAEETVNDWLTVKSVWRQAFADVDCEPIGVELARTATLLRYVGASVDGETRPLNLREIAAELCDRYGHRADAKRIGRITRAARQVVYEGLRARSLVPEEAIEPRREEAEEMADPNLLRGWAAIAAHLGVSEDTAQRWTRDEALPVKRLVGMVEATRADLDRWRAERREDVA